MSIKFLEFVQNAVDEAKGDIAELAKTKLTDKNKKSKLDEKITEFITTGMDKVGLNWIAKLAVKKLILPHISDFTQIIYDLLKEKIDGVTSTTDE
jgi:hypothetical protein